MKCFKHSFLIRLTADWNSLGGTMFNEAGSLELFKLRIRSVLKLLFTE